MNNSRLKTRWLIFSILGLLLLGLGLSLLGEAIINKFNDMPWFFLGTLALVVFNGGICFVAEAIQLKIQMKKH